MIVPSWTLGYEKSGFRCRDCHMKVEMHSPFLTMVDAIKGAVFDNRVRCPVCSSSEKEPTAKMSQKDIEKKKREILASHMVSPIRCGGLYYYEGKGMYKFGKHFVSSEILETQRDKLDEYLTEGGHDHERCEMLWTKLMRPRKQRNQND